MISDLNLRAYMCCWNYSTAGNRSILQKELSTLHSLTWMAGGVPRPLKFQGTPFDKLLFQVTRIHMIIYPAFPPRTYLDSDDHRCVSIMEPNYTGINRTWVFGSVPFLVRFILLSVQTPDCTQTCSLYSFHSF